MIDLGIHVRIEPVLGGVRLVPRGLRHLVDERIRTIDLMFLKPYFQGTTRRIGAPFWFISVFAVEADREKESGFIASSIRSPSMYGQSSPPLAGRASPTDETAS